MNKERRKKIAAIMEDLEILKNRIQEVLDDETDAFENMGEGLQASDVGSASEDAQECMECAIEAVEDAVASLEEVL